MSARVLDGRAIAQAVRSDLADMAKNYTGRTGSTAGLAIVRAGHDPASQVYVSALERTATAVGVQATRLDLPDDIDDTGFRACLESLNADPAVHGILVQLPLPSALSKRTLAETLDPRKDVDGISLRSAGNLFLRLPSFVPSTCAAVLEILDRSGTEVRGRRVIIVGASDVVGKPLAFLLLHRDATVSVCHIYTSDLPEMTRQADILISAAGKAGLIRGDMVSPGATVIDVGINVMDTGILGDVEFASVAPVAGAITPVPGGVGQLTNLMLIKQTLLAADGKITTAGISTFDTDISPD